MSGPPGPRIEVIRFADPWCWWSWCMEPVVRRLEERYGDGIAVTYRMGGMFEDVQDWLTAEGEDQAAVTEAVHAAGQAAGVPIQADYLWRCEAKSSHPACLAYKASEIRGKDPAHRYFRRLMEAFMIECQRASYDALARLSEEVGLLANQIRKDIDLPGVKASFEEDMRVMHETGAEYDCLIIQGPGGEIVRVEGFVAEPYEEAIDTIVPDLPKRRPADIIEYAAQRRTVFAREVAEVFQVADESAEDRLRTLASSGLLAPSEDKALWRWSGPEPDTLPVEAIRAGYVPKTVEDAADLDALLAQLVRNRFTEVAERPTGASREVGPRYAFRFPVGPEAAVNLGYAPDQLATIPPSALESFSGVGNVFLGGEIGRKDTVLDVGCGSGTDVLLAANLADKRDVYALDSTPAMVAKARASVSRGKVENVKVLEGNASSTPLGDETADVVTINGVLHLVSDKEGVLRQAARVLRHEGRLLLAEVVVRQDVKAVLGPTPELWSDGLSGAPVEVDLLRAIESAGFRDVKLVKHYDYYGTSPSSTLRRIARAFGAQSVVISAARSSEPPAR